MGVDPAPLLAKSGVSPEVLQQPNQHLTPEQELGFTRLVVEQLDQPDFGLYVGSAYHLSAYGVLGLAITTSNNLLDATRLLFKNILMTWTYMRWSLSRDEDVVFVQLHPLMNLGNCHQYMIDRDLIASYLIFKEAIAQKLPLIEVNLTHQKPDYADQYDELFECPIKFGSDANGFVFDAKYLYEPLLQADAGTNAIYASECEDICQQLQGDVHFADLIKQHILSNEGHQCNLEFIAQKLYTTPRTVQRKLAAEGTTYKKILEQVRRNHASKYLHSTNLTIDEIAYKLGYNEASAFCHAFKRWTGTSPRNHRT